MPSTRRDRKFGLATSVAVKAPVVVASTGFLVLSGSTQIIDGRSASTGERILVKNQSGSTITGSTLNGIYEIRTGDWQRSADCDGFPDLVPGSQVFVTTGSTENDQGGRYFTVDSTSSTDGFIRPDTDAMDWKQLDALLNPKVISTGEVVTSMLADGAVTLVKMADLDSQRFIGRNTTGTGVPESIDMATARTMLGDVGDNITDLVIDHGADPTGIVDASTRIQDAIETRKSVYAPPGHYKTSTQIEFLHVNSTDTSRGQLFYGAGQDVSFIDPTTDFPSTSKVLYLGTGEPGPIIRDIKIAFTSTAPANRAGLPSQPDAIFADATPRFEIENVKITKGMNGIIYNANCGGSLIKNVKLSCFEKNIVIDGSLDTVRIKDVHVWPFDLLASDSTMYQTIFYDSDSRALEVGRCDGLVVEGMTTFGPVTLLRTGTTEFGSTLTGAALSAGAFGQFTDCDFDNFGGLAMELGTITMNGCVFTIGSTLARHAISLGSSNGSTFAMLSVAGCYFLSAVDADAAGPTPNNTLISHAQGHLNVTGCHFDLAGSTMRAIVSFTGGLSEANAMVVTGNTFRNRAATMANAVVIQTLDKCVVVGNKFERIVTPISELTNKDTNTIHGNDYGSTIATSFSDFMELRNISSTRRIVNFQTDNDGAESGPIITIVRKSANAANGDLGGDIRFQMNTANGTGEIMGRILNKLIDNSNGAETGEIVIQAPVGGSLASRMGFSDGVIVGAPIGGYQGSGTINSTGYYVNGALIGTGSGTVTGVTGSAPIVSDGNSVTPNITINTGTESARGALRIATNVETLAAASSTVVLSVQDLATWWAAPGTVLGSITPGAAIIGNLRSSGFQATQGAASLVTNEGHATNGSYTGNVFLSRATRAANAAYNLYVGFSSNLGDKEFQVTGAGVVTADGTITGGGADYAEYFEWDDGNLKNEDRRGHSVILLPNGKIREARRGDRDLIGIVSANPTLTGNAAWNKWHGKYQRDRFGAYILSCKGNRWRNPKFDPKKIYIPRADRQEWGCVGLVGRLRLVKGQPTDPRWLFMGNVSKSIEEWLAR